MRRVTDRFQPGLVGLGAQPTVSTDQATVTCDHVVVATQVPFLDRAAWFARLQPHRSYVLACRTARPAPRTMLLSVDAPSRSVRTASDPDGGELVLVGGDGHVPGQGPRHPRARPRRWPAGPQHAFGLEQVVCRWAAQDYTPLDGLPKVGALWPAPTRILVATGYDKWGLTNGTAAAQVLAGHVLGEQPDWAEAYTPHRLDVRRAVPSFLQANADTAKELGKGWVGALSRAGGAAPAEGEGVVHPTARPAVRDEHRRRRHPQRQRRLPAPRRRPVVERCRPVLGLPAARQPVRARRGAAAGTGQRRPPLPGRRSRGLLGGDELVGDVGRR